MKRFSGIIYSLSKGGMAIGAVFLCLMLALIVANVIVRLFGGVIAGSYELVEMMAIVTVAFALGYTALNKSHIIVDFVVSRLPSSFQSSLSSINSALSFITWGIIGWAGYRVMLERWLNEETEMLEVFVLPFRIIWLSGIAILCLVFLLDFINSFYREKK